MTEAEESFVIPLKKRKLEVLDEEDSEKEGSYDFTFSGSDRIAFHKTHLALRPIVADYIQESNDRLALKQALLLREAEHEKDVYIDSLNMLYTRVMNAVERDVRTGNDLSYSYRSSVKDYEKTHPCVYAAFQCIKRELEAKGWSPLIQSVPISNTNPYEWEITICCLFQ